MKYLLATNSKLRQQIRLERRDPRERERFPEPLPRPSLAESQDAANFKPSSSSSKLEARKIDAKIGQSTPQGEVSVSSSRCSSFTSGGDSGGFDRPMSPGSIKKLLPDDASTSALIQRCAFFTGFLGLFLRPRHHFGLCAVGQGINHDTRRNKHTSSGCAGKYLAAST